MRFRLSTLAADWSELEVIFRADDERDDNEERDAATIPLLSLLPLLDEPEMALEAAAPALPAAAASAALSAAAASAFRAASLALSHSCCR